MPAAGTQAGLCNIAYHLPDSTAEAFDRNLLLPGDQLADPAEKARISLFFPIGTWFSYLEITATLATDRGLRHCRLELS